MIFTFLDSPEDGLLMARVCKRFHVYNLRERVRVALSSWSFAGMLDYLITPAYTEVWFGTMDHLRSEVFPVAPWNYNTREDSAAREWFTTQILNGRTPTHEEVCDHFIARLRQHNAKSNA